MWLVSKCLKRRKAVTLPDSNARFSRTIPRRPKIVPPNHSMPDTLHTPHISHLSVPSAPSSSSTSVVINVQRTDHEHALNFATHSWDLATGGLKTLTAKRELPIRPERRVSEVVPDMLATSRSNTFVLVILVCVACMLIGGGIVFFVMLQP